MLLGSSLSQSNTPGLPDRRSGGGGGGAGGGSNNPPTTSDYLMSQETNRQILLILVRLREDTNNVLTRLSFLESSVVSLQVGLNFKVKFDKKIFTFFGHLNFTYMGLVCLFVCL